MVITDALTNPLSYKYKSTESATRISKGLTADYFQGCSNYITGFKIGSTPGVICTFVQGFTNLRSLN